MASQKIFSLRHSRVSAILVLTCAALVSFAFVSHAQDSTEVSDEEVVRAGIAFPVTELGNCGDKEACRRFCDEPSNMRRCIAFARAHGFMDETQAGRAERFVGRLETGNTPGGCTGEESCKAYCSDITRIEECLAFAEEHGVDDNHTQEGRKIRAYLTQGGKMPGGCTSKESCEAYCSSFEHVEECVNFARAAGLKFEGEELPSPQMIELLKRGETPGGCRGREACEAYCRDEAHIEECVAFGRKAGFMSDEEAELARKTGGKGPGGCKGPAECRTYCDDPTHREACFEFAKEHGLIRPEDVEQMKEGLVRVRQGLQNAPPGVATCLRERLGPNIIADIEAGTLTPGPSIGERMRECFEQFGGGGHNPRELFQNAPPEVLSCLEREFGGDFARLRSGEMQLTPEHGSIFRKCFELFRPQSGAGSDSSGGPSFVGGGVEFLKRLPEEVRACIREKLGPDFIGELESGKRLPDADFQVVVRGCVAATNVGGATDTTRPKEFPDGAIDAIKNFPPEVRECVARIVGSDKFQAIVEGRASASPEIVSVMQKCAVEVQTRNIRDAAPQDIEPFRAVPIPGVLTPVGPQLTPFLEPNAICTDLASCTRICTDSTNTNFNSEICMKFRASLQSFYAPPSRGILGTMLAPFLELIGQ